MEVITQNTIDVFGLSDIRQKIMDNVRMSAYWGVEPKHKPHIEMLIPLLKIRDLSLFNIGIKILFADTHALLNKVDEDDDKTDEKCIIYEQLFTHLIRILNINVEKISFEKGSEIQMDRRYMIDMYRILNHVTINKALEASSSVIDVKTSKPCLNQAMYPILQILDETMLDVDIQIGNIHQKKIFALGSCIQKLGYKKCSYILTPVLPKFSRFNFTDYLNYIYFSDTNDEIREKINNMRYTEKNNNIEKTPALAICKYIVYPVEKKVIYDTYDELEHAWKNGRITKDDLKTCLFYALCEIIEPIREFLLNLDMFGSVYSDIEI